MIPVNTKGSYSANSALFPVLRKSSWNAKKNKQESSSPGSYIVHVNVNSMNSGQKTDFLNQSLHEPSLIINLHPRNDNFIHSLFCISSIQMY